MKRTSIKRKPYKWKVKQDPIMKLWSQCVRTRDGKKCQLCGTTKGVMHAHHFIGRRKAQTKYLVENGICLCFVCHNEVGDYSNVNEDLFIKTVGSERKEELEVLSGITGRKLNREEIKQSLKNKLALLGGEL